MSSGISSHVSFLANLNQLADQRREWRIERRDEPHSIVDENNKEAWRSLWPRWLSLGQCVPVARPKWLHEIQAMPPSLKHEYDLFVENQCEVYKDSISHAVLLKIADEAVASLQGQAQLAMNEVLLCDEVDRIILKRLRLPSYAKWRQSQGIKTTVTPALIDAQGLPVKAGAPPPLHLVSVAEIDQQLLKALRDNPLLLHGLTPRKFEHLIAELLNRDGWEIEVTQASRDGGKDVIATLRTSGICSVYYIECKRYAPKRPVSVKAVRELIGIVHAKRVTAGMLVTTSGFTRSARDLQSIEPHRITLKAYTDIVTWLKAARRKGTDDV